MNNLSDLRDGIAETIMPWIGSTDFAKRQYNVQAQATIIADKILNLKVKVKCSDPEYCSIDCGQEKGECTGYIEKTLKEWWGE